MKKRTLRMHLKIIRLARGILNCWMSWIMEEAEECGYVDVIQEADPTKVLKPSAHNGPS